MQTFDVFVDPIAQLQVGQNSITPRRSVLGGGRGGWENTKLRQGCPSSILRPDSRSTSKWRAYLVSYFFVACREVVQMKNWIEAELHGSNRKLKIAMLGHWKI